MTDHDLQVHTDLQGQTADILRTVLSPHNRDLPDSVAVVDFPRHDNAGDSLIWAGEMQYLRRLGVDVGYRTDIGRFSSDALRRKVPDGPILMHGGGNFGDVWPHHQAFREHIIREFPDRQLVVLPQSIFFADDSMSTRARTQADAHSDLTVLVRDDDSWERAESLLPASVRLYCPDMALGVDPWHRLRSPDVDIVFLARRDRERGDDTSNWRHQSQYSVLEADWSVAPARAISWHTRRLPGMVYKRGGRFARTALEPLHQRMYEPMVRSNLRAANLLLSRGRVVVTDRLHAHVMCVLLGIPHVLLDNSYGKVSSVYRSYTHRFESVHFASSGAEVLASIEAAMRQQQLHSAYHRE